MATLDFFRTSVGAAALGMAARALDEAKVRVKARRQFGKALADFQATQLALADMAVDVAAVAPAWSSRRRIASTAPISRAASTRRWPSCSPPKRRSG